MRVAAIIPARYASQRLPAKPLADICGKPMVQHVYERAAQATRVDEVIIATDDRRIADVVDAFGGKAILTPATLQSGTDRIAFVARDLRADFIVNVQGDEPLIAPEAIDEAIAIVEQSDSLVGTLAKQIEREAELFNPNVVKVVIGAEGNCLYFSRGAIPFGREMRNGDWLRHHTFYKHIGIYAFRKNFLIEFSKMKPTPLEQAEKLEQLRILEHGYKIKAAITVYDSTPVDTVEDLQIVRELCSIEHE